MARMTDAEYQAFLTTPVLCRLGCLDEEGYPYVVPCWFHYADDGFYIIPRERSAWAAYLQQDGRVSLCIDAESGARVLVKGIATLVETPNVGGRWVAIAREMAVRYRGEAGLVYLAASLQEPRWLFFVTPSRITTWAGGGWAAKYKHYQW
ncbi:MAG: pyridoxamine 5'-phosphate oxidase family protein [Caldilineaceae bacterium]